MVELSFIEEACTEWLSSSAEEVTEWFLYDDYAMRSLHHPSSYPRSRRATAGI
jgi:hypothetical protein